VTTVALPPQFDLSVDALRVVGEVGFNDWQRAGDQLFKVESSVMWYLGDWWLEGVKRFGTDYRDGLERIAQQHETVLKYARVSRAFPPRLESRALTSDTYPGLEVHRISEVPWRHHYVLASISDEQERMAWLEDVLRQNWSQRQLEDELSKASDRVSRPAPLTFRPEGDLRIRVEANAAAIGMAPREYALIALEEALREPRVLKAIERRLQRRGLEAA
jgi:hypothetical protein